MYLVSFASGRQSYALKITFNIALCTSLPCYVLGFKIKIWFWTNCMLLSSIVGLIFPHLIFQWKVLPVYHVILIRYSSSRDASLQILVISFCDNLIIIAITCMSCGTKGVLIWENSHQCEFHAEMTSWFCIAVTCSHVFSLSHDQHDDVILNCQNHTCATRSSLPADQFHTVTSGRFAFTWYCCKILYLSEILSLRLQPRWTHAGVTWHFVVVSCKQIQSHANQSELVPAQKLPKCHVNTP